MVLLDSEVSTEEPTPPLRRAGSALVPPPPPPEEVTSSPRDVGHATSMEPTADLPPEDVEATIVDSEPPNFATDAYRAARDRRDT